MKQLCIVNIFIIIIIIINLTIILVFVLFFFITPIIFIMFRLVCDQERPTRRASRREKTPPARSQLAAKLPNTRLEQPETKAIVEQREPITDAMEPTTVTDLQPNTSEPDLGSQLTSMLLNTALSFLTG